VQSEYRWAVVATGSKGQVTVTATVRHHISDRTPAALSFWLRQSISKSLLSQTSGSRLYGFVRF
jgi:hypothetical protein